MHHPTRHHIWNVIDNGQGTKTHPPAFQELIKTAQTSFPLRPIRPMTRPWSDHEQGWPAKDSSQWSDRILSTFISRRFFSTSATFVATVTFPSSAPTTLSEMNFTNCWACHIQCISWLMPIKFMTPFALRGAPDIIRQSHQLLSLTWISMNTQMLLVCLSLPCKTVQSNPPRCFFDPATRMPMPLVDNQSHLSYGYPWTPRLSPLCPVWKRCQCHQHDDCLGISINSPTLPGNKSTMNAMDNATTHMNIHGYPDPRSVSQPVVWMPRLTDNQSHFLHGYPGIPRLFYLFQSERHANAINIIPIYPEKDHQCYGQCRHSHGNPSVFRSSQCVPNLPCGWSAKWPWSKAVAANIFFY